MTHSIFQDARDTRRTRKIIEAVRFVLRQLFFEVQRSRWGILEDTIGRGLFQRIRI
jgi:hypothetical protein